MKIISENAVEGLLEKYKKYIKTTNPFIILVKLCDEI